MRDQKGEVLLVFDPLVLVRAGGSGGGAGEHRAESVLLGVPMWRRALGRRGRLWVGRARGLTSSLPTVSSESGCVWRERSAGDPRGQCAGGGL
jgi:hypothetical protein